MPLVDGNHAERQRIFNLGAWEELNRQDQPEAGKRQVRQEEKTTPFDKAGSTALTTGQGREVTEVSGGSRREKWPRKNLTRLAPKPKDVRVDSPAREAAPLPAKHLILERSRFRLRLFGSQAPSGADKSAVNQGHSGRRLSKLRPPGQNPPVRFRWRAKLAEP